MLQAMDLEFHESDIFFSSDEITRELDGSRTDASSSSRKGRGRPRKSSSSKNSKNKVVIHTVPVDVPCDFFHRKRDPGSRSTGHGLEFYDCDDDYNDGEMVPPHVIVGRRIAGKMAFSVCTGIGRTLKGRDLSEVRNSILRLTGFLES